MGKPLPKANIALANSNPTAKQSPAACCACNTRDAGEWLIKETARVLRMVLVTGPEGNKPGASPSNLKIFSIYKRSRKNFAAKWPDALSHSRSFVAAFALWDSLKNRLRYAGPVAHVSYGLVGGIEAVAAGSSARRFVTGRGTVTAR